MQSSATDGRCLERQLLKDLLILYKHEWKELRKLDEVHGAFRCHDVGMTSILGEDMVQKDAYSVGKYFMKELFDAAK